MDNSERMSPLERRGAASLASIYGLRMLGMFLILPVFSVYAQNVPGGQDHMLVGLALGMYGFTQALLQLPFGMASDRLGRKRVIYVGLVLFALGSFMAASAHDIYGIIIGRAIQGGGAISAVVTALMADLTREEHRTKAMAMIGGTIGMTFAFSLVLGPAFYHFIGIPGIFAMTGVLALVAIGVVKYAIPDPQVSRFHSDTEASTAKLKDVLKDPQLLRLNFGIFALHATQMAMFVVIPIALKNTGGIDANHHWEVYLPIMIVSFILMVPAIIYGEKKAKLKQVFVGAIAILLVAETGLSLSMNSFFGIVLMLLIFFVAFNILEATLPSIISKIAPAGSKGTAMGVYNTSQSFGLFLGGALGGYLSSRYGFGAVFVFGAVLMGLWFLMAASMKAPRAVKTKMYHVKTMGSDEARSLMQKLIALDGVTEAVVLAEEGVAYLKVNMQGWNEQGVMDLIKGSA